MCDCFQIGGPWIAEDPDCPEHGADSEIRRTQAESLIDDIGLVDLSDTVKVARLLIDVRAFLSSL